jgi:DNA invertase Pin-like site-specific DNA recombinase
MTKVCLLIRVSTEKQDTDRQLLELTEFCRGRNYEIVQTISSKISGTKEGRNRPDLLQLFEIVKRGEISKVIVTEISRLGRKSRDIRATLDTLHKEKVSIIFKNFGGIESLDDADNETFVTNIIISIYAELAQEERRILIERTKSGLVAARAKGKILGRPVGSASSEEILKKYSKLAECLESGRTLSECMKIHDVSKNTVLKVKRNLKGIYESNI